jgi:histidine ammonia-lyase
VNPPATPAGSFVPDPSRSGFRNLPQIQAASFDVFDHVDGQLAIELNASQGNPIVVPAEDRLISVANFEILPLAAALDYLRIVLATALTSTSERTVKALGTPWSGLLTGLTPLSGTAEAGLTYLSLAAQSLAVEARLLAQPVSVELTSTAHAEGIEDRTTMAPLAARRVGEMAAIRSTIVAIELAVAAQAVQLRGLRQGHGTGRAIATIRRVVPYLESGDNVPDVTALADAVRSGAFGGETQSGDGAGVDRA